MFLPFDPEFEEVVAPIFAAHPPPPSFSGGDAHNAHKVINPFFQGIMAKQPKHDDVDHEILTATSADGHQLKIFASYPKSHDKAKPGPAILFIHAGGFISTSAEIWQPVAANLAHLTKRPVFSVEYRLAFEAAYPAALNDSIAALKAVHSHAQRLGIDTSRIALYGESAGGNLAISTALAAAKDATIPKLAAVVAVYPMIDDRTSGPGAGVDASKVGWGPIDNTTGWKCYLGNKHGTDDIPSTAAPARATDEELKSLPKLYVEVGGYDLFLAEDVAFAARTIAAGVQTELHVWPGVPHGFELTAPEIKVSKLAMARRVNALTSF